MSIVTVNHLNFSYPAGKPVLKDVTLAVEPGESLGIIGANGVGKSTLLKLFVGLERVEPGALSVCGLPVTKASLPGIRAKCGYVFQDSDSQMFMATVGEDVAFAPKNYGLSADAVTKRVDAALAAVHIEELRDAKNYQLSGGQKKLASIATILSMEPELILMDEPSVALDPKNRRNLIHVLKELSGTLIIASHDLDFIYDTCERTVLMAGGTVIADGETRVLLKDQSLLEANGLELPLSFTVRA